MFVVVMGYKRHKQLRQKEWDETWDENEFIFGSDI